MTDNIIENKSFEFAVRIAKMSIALKEANESLYWIKLLNRTEYISKAQFTSLETDITEIIKILTSICKTSTK